MPSNLIYSTIDLIQVVPNLKTAQSFLLDRFFPNIVTSDTEEAVSYTHLTLPTTPYV